jgi:hypothetical protein
MANLYIQKQSAAAIEAELFQVQNRARVRRLTVEQILAAAETAELFLNTNNLPQRMRVDCKYFMFGPRMPKAYRYPSYSTEAVLVRKRKGWVLHGVSREMSWPVSYGQSRVNRLQLSRPAHEHILRNSPQYFLVQELVAKAYRDGAANALKTSPQNQPS